ncbi:MAG: DNA polymerase III subunit delta [Balneolaceae bacterium]
MAYKSKSNSLDTFRSLYKEIKNGQFNKPIYYLYGDEMFLIDLIQDEIEKILPPGQKDFNFDLIYAGESVPSSVLNIAGSYPMMAERRIVVVRDFMRFDENPDGNKTIEFTEYLKRPNPSTILCLIDQKFPDKRRDPGRFLNSKEIAKSVGIYEFSAIPEQNLPEWVIDWTDHRHQMKISPMAAQLLAHLAGPELKLLSTEIEKLCTFVDSDVVITEDHVKKVTESYREYNIIELKNAVISRDLDKSLMIAEQMLLKSNNSTGELFKTVGFFYTVFSNIWQICRLTEKGLNKNQVQEVLGEKRTFVFNHQYRDASNFRLAEMPHIFEALLDTDRSLKGFSTLDNPTIFLLLIKRIVG